MAEAPELNVVLLRSRAGDIREQLAVLRGYGAMEQAAFRGNSEAVRSARYAMLVLVEAAGAIGSHLCARRLAAGPSSHADGFLRLAAAGLLPVDLGSRLAAMAQLGSLLVQRYETIDDAQFHSYLQQELPAVDDYLCAVDVLLEAAEAGGGGA